MRIFIAGASGLVGSNCYYHFTAEGMNVLGSYFSFPTNNTVYFNTLDIHDTANADLAAFRPDIIVHCGALTHVDYCEDHVEESYSAIYKKLIRNRQTKRSKVGLYLNRLCV
mgnify:CR=1 FL=1